MAALSDARIASLIHPYYPSPTPLLLSQLSAYLDLLLKWNAKTNLSAIREPEAMVERHFGESLFVAGFIPASTASLLDLGSGAGFPGIPIQLAHPGLIVTLAESQNKKSAFLREVCRALSLSTRVHAGRAEALPVGAFDVVALRAVDNPIQALELAAKLTKAGGAIFHLGKRQEGLFHSLPRSDDSGLNIISM